MSDDGPSRACALADAVLLRYDTGTISGIIAMPYWLHEFHTETKNGKPDITSSQSSLIVSILSAGTFLGALCASPMGDYLGRRMGLIVSNFFFNLGVVLQTVATSIPMFVAGRFWAGFGVGLISALSKWPLPCPGARTVP